LTVFGFLWKALSTPPSTNRFLTDSAVLSEILSSRLIKTFVFLPQAFGAHIEKQMHQGKDDDPCGVFALLYYAVEYVNFLL
jgi:hypothetical protein